MLPRVLEPEVMDTADEAEAYDAMDHAEANAAFVERVTELCGEAGTAAGSIRRILDLGTGPGEIPLLLGERLSGVKIVGVDLSWQMLRIARQRQVAAAADVARRVSFQLADVKALPFADAGFDAVISNTILHHVPEPAAMLRETARVVRPGGVVLIRDLYRPESTQRLEELVALHTGDCTADQQQMFAASLHAALTPRELRETADACGLADAEVVIDSDRHMSLQRWANTA